MPERDGVLNPALRRMLQVAYDRHSTVSVQLAEALRLEPNTIDNMFAQAENILGVSGRSGAITRALKQGWIQHANSRSVRRVR